MCIRDSLGIPLVGLGFIYRQGYFIQKITEDGWQETRNYIPVSYTHLRAHETPEHLVCRLLLEKKKQKLIPNIINILSSQTQHYT